MAMTREELLRQFASLSAKQKAQSTIKNKPVAAPAPISQKPLPSVVKAINDTKALNNQPDLGNVYSTQKTAYQTGITGSRILPDVRPIQGPKPYKPKGLLEFLTERRTVDDPFFLGLQQGTDALFGGEGPKAPGSVTGKSVQEIRAMNPMANLAGNVVGGVSASLPTYAIANPLVQKIPTLAKLAATGKLGKVAATLAADQVADTLVLTPGFLLNSITNDKTMGEDAKKYGEMQVLNFVFNSALRTAGSAIKAVWNAAKKANLPIETLLESSDEAAAAVKNELGLPETSSVTEVTNAIKLAEGVNPKAVAEQLKATQSGIPMAEGANIAAIKEGLQPKGEPVGTVIRPEIAPQRAQVTEPVIPPRIDQTTTQPDITTTASERLAPGASELGMGARPAPTRITPPQAEPAPGMPGQRTLENPVDQRIATVLTEMPKPNTGSLVDKLRALYQATVSTSAPLEKIGGNVPTLTSLARKSSGTTDYAIQHAMIDREGNVLGEGLESILKDIPKAQKKDFFDFALHQHNIARMAQGKPVYGETMTADVSAAELERLKAINPDFVEKSKALTNYINNLMDGWALKSGLVSQEGLDVMRKMYPDYVPTGRDRTELARQMNNAAGGGLNVIRAATGSSRNILPLDQQIAKMTDRVIKASRKNELFNELARVSGLDPNVSANKFRILSKESQMLDDGMDGVIDSMDDPIKKQGDSYILNFFSNGEKVQAEISKDVYTALRTLGDLTDEQAVASVVRKYGTTPFKSLITQYNPLFAASNVMRDVPTAILYSHSPIEWAKNVPVALKEIVSNGKYWQEYKALGGTRSGIFTAEKGVEPLFKGEGNPVKQFVKKGLNNIEAFNNLTETMPRFAEYLATVKKGGNTYDSKLLGMMRASEITTDFTRSGRATKFVDSFVPYLNPSVQGIDRFMRQLKQKPLQMIARGGVLLTVPTLILDQINKNNAEYKELSAREKNGFYQVPDGEGGFYRIPKARETAVVFSTLFEWLARRARGEQVTGEEVFNTVKENFSPVNPVDNTLFTPLYRGVKQILEPDAEVRNFAGIPIEPMGLKQLPPGQRYDAYTSDVAKVIGGELNISPKALDYIMRSYSGIIGQTLLPKTSQKTQPGLGGVIQAKFKTDPVMKSDNTNKFYNALQEAQFAANKVDLDMGYKGALDKDIKTQEEMVVSALTKVSKELSDYRKQQKEIDQNPNIDQARKAEMIRNLQKTMNEIAKRALKNESLWVD